jgi:high affinity Mn2+ porin
LSRQSPHFNIIERETHSVRFLFAKTEYFEFKLFTNGERRWLHSGTLLYSRPSSANRHYWKITLGDEQMNAGSREWCRATVGWFMCLLVLSSGRGGAQEQPPAGGDQKPAQGQEEKKPASKPLPQISPEARYDYQGEATFILQNLFKFHSPYEGPSSFRSRNETELSDTYTLYLGARLVKNVEVYVNPEIAWGNGVSKGAGLAGGVNGDLIGQPSLRPEPYLARFFVRWRVPMPHIGRHAGTEKTTTEQTGRSPNVIEGSIPAHRLVVQVGKFAVSDVFDFNSYANSPRTQFLNNAFGNNLAYDLAEETRGYDLGASVSWINPNFDVRFGTFAMPTTAGGPDLAINGSNDHSEQLEIELHPQLLRAPKPPFIARLLAFRNVGDMGSYRDALARQQPGMPPNLASVRKQGSVKYGFGLNFEQALANGGDTGIFGRLGWNDGATESFAYAEADTFLSFGGQLSGANWKRKDDRVGVAFAQSDISTAHKDYLAAGGQGLALGDGQLRYGSERIVEAYYLYQMTKALSLTLDYQYVANPGYNRDRGPASLIALRAHVAF